MPKYLSQIQKMSEEEFWEEYDKQSKARTASTNLWFSEAVRRENKKTNSQIKKLTKQMRNMTFVILIATIANIIIFLFN